MINSILSEVKLFDLQQISDQRGDMFILLDGEDTGASEPVC